MKIYPINILNYIKDHNVEDTIFLLYGSNLGLLDEIYKKILEKLNFDLNDPFSNVKINSSQLINYENILIEELTTLSVFQSCKNILLDLRDISPNDIILKILKNTFSASFKNYKLVILGGHIKTNSPLIKFFNTFKNCLQIPCYEEDTSIFESKVKNYIIKNEIKLSESELSKVLLKLSKDSKINNNIFEKLDLISLSNEVNTSTFFESFDDNVETDTNMLVDYSLCGEFSKAINILHKSKLSKVSSILICKKFLYKLKIIESLLNYLGKGFSFEHAISKSDIKVFFKEKNNLFKQTKIWNKKSVNLCINKFIKTEINCKLNSEIDYNYLEIAMMFIQLQTSKNL